MLPKSRRSQLHGKLPKAGLIFLFFYFFFSVEKYAPHRPMAQKTKEEDRDLWKGRGAPVNCNAAVNTVAV